MTCLEPRYVLPDLGAPSLEAVVEKTTDIPTIIGKELSLVTPVLLQLMAATTYH